MSREVRLLVYEPGKATRTIMWNVNVEEFSNVDNIVFNEDGSLCEDFGTFSESLSEEDSIGFSKNSPSEKTLELLDSLPLISIKKQKKIDRMKKIRSVLKNKKLKQKLRKLRKKEAAKILENDFCSACDFTTISSFNHRIEINQCPIADSKSTNNWKNSPQRENKFDSAEKLNASDGTNNKISVAAKFTENSISNCQNLIGTKPSSTQAGESTSTSSTINRNSEESITEEKLPAFIRKSWMAKNASTKNRMNNNTNNKCIKNLDYIPIDQSGRFPRKMKQNRYFSLEKCDLYDDSNKMISTEEFRISSENRIGLSEDYPTDLQNLDFILERSHENNISHGREKRNYSTQNYGERNGKTNAHKVFDKKLINNADYISLNAGKPSSTKFQKNGFSSRINQNQYFSYEGNDKRDVGNINSCKDDFRNLNYSNNQDCDDVEREPTKNLDCIRTGLKPSSSEWFSNNNSPPKRHLSVRRDNSHEKGTAIKPLIENLNHSERLNNNGCDFIPNKSSNNFDYIPINHETVNPVRFRDDYSNSGPNIHRYFSLTNDDQHEMDEPKSRTDGLFDKFQIFRRKVPKASRNNHIGRPFNNRRKWMDSTSFRKNIPGNPNLYARGRGKKNPSTRGFFGN